MLRHFWCLLLITLSISAVSAAPNPEKEHPMSVVMVNPSVKDDPFWRKVEQLTQEAATQLGVHFEVIYGEGNRFAQLDVLKRYLEYRATPDYLILINYPGGAEQSLSMLSKYNIKFVTLEQTISGAERTAIGHAGEHFENWLGEIYHDNFKAGYLLAKTLTQTLQQPKEHVKPILINGHYGSESDARSDGAKAYFKEQGIDVAQTVFAAWSKDQAMEKTEKLMKRYPDTNLIWCASDLMALGSETALRQSASTANVAIGGFDWLDDALIYIKKGKLSASVGGHFMMGAWALLSLYDYHHGNPYWSTHQKMVFDLEAITKENIDQFNGLQQPKEWEKIDFRALTLTHSGLKEYQFIHRFDELLHSLK
ncbi:ABC transporter substrate-binding protein [Pseudoalteromonas xiamenensis]|uniref:ABC transporter substrate-binding protein n=1 Tax=Pseudoalteromonas xiamenensis TaxID=882626 RepID=UPI0027E5418F|nr:ABC transporter substrate-binding protein [Pseudoalteromonas xiamenensis]WMN58424.1 ABC transporter substrate-binding protein [Pseudoalteromonas xiamenensis]